MKRRKKPSQPCGDPSIARPNKQQGNFIRALLLHAPTTAKAELKVLFNELLPYEKQLALVYAWFFEMLRIVDNDDEAPAREACVALQIPFRKSVGRLLQLALGRRESIAKKWAGTMLANIAVSISKYDERLSKTNKTYVSEKEKIGKVRIDLLFPKPIGKAVRRELRKAERYRDTLVLLKAACGEAWTNGEAWTKLVRKQRIPKAYWPLAELPEFSMESEPRWWELQWPLIKQNNPNLLRKLREGKFPTRGIRYRPRWASYRKEFRNVLRTLARYQSEGTLIA